MYCTLQDVLLLEHVTCGVRVHQTDRDIKEKIVLIQQQTKCSK